MTKNQQAQGVRGCGEVFNVVLSSQVSHFCTCAVQVRALVNLDSELGKRSRPTEKESCQLPSPLFYVWNICSFVLY